MASTTNDYRLTNVTNEKNNALNDMNNKYNTMISDSNSYYQNLINASKDYQNKQSQIQQENTNFTIEKLEQQKAKQERDYTKEQKGAYTDYEKAIDKYGVGAEEMASKGMSNTGYSETSKMTAFNTYQNRYATARQSYNDAIMNYDNSIKEARLQNNSALAEIAYNSLQKQLELSLEGFKYKNELIQQQFSNKMDIESLYETKYNNVLNQINTENSLAEQKRQFDAQMAENKRQFNSQMSYKRSSSGSGGSESLTDGGGSSSGYFSNGYQPDNVDGKKLSSAGKATKYFTFNKNQSKLASQNVWTANGKYYMWIGNGNNGGDYVDVTSKVNSAKKKNQCVVWGL